MKVDKKEKGTHETRYETVIGLEVHAHLKTESKMFCSCATSPRGRNYELDKKDEPNIRICPICFGCPGTLPMPNKEAIENIILLGLALKSEISKKFIFERKNYYYPDLPKGYQITSATNPPVIGGGLDIEVSQASGNNDKEFKFIELDHIHLEEDAGKLIHEKSGDYSLVDLNRAGTPLLEIITKPVISSSFEAVEFMKSLRSILRYLDISDADMEKGQMRCDANVSVRKVGSKKLGIKTEIKNINSFKMVASAIEYESKLQIETLKSGNKIKQQTKGWDANKGKTTSQRSKEYVSDYRYFPEPDIPQVKLVRNKHFNISAIRKKLPEMPREKRVRFKKEYGLNNHEAHVISINHNTARYFEEVVKKLPQTVKNGERIRKIGKQIADFIISGLLGKKGDFENIYELKVTPSKLAELINLLNQGEITRKTAKDILTKVVDTGDSPSKIVKSEGIKKIDSSEAEEIVKRIISKNPNEVRRYRSGEKKLFGFFMGQVMRESKGQADPTLVSKLLKKKIG